jgi:hypothetical protein
MSISSTLSEIFLAEEQREYLFPHGMCRRQCRFSLAELYPD